MNCRNIKHLCKGLLGSLLLAACTQADEWETTGGDTGLLVTLTEQTTEADTRATPQELREALGETEFLKGFHLKVAHINNGKVPYDAAYREGLIAIPAGFYNLTATYGDNPALALDAPYYTGTTEYVEVKGHQQKQVSIACRVANALVSVRYENTEKLDALFSTYHVNVQVGEESVNIRDNRQSAYFRAGTVPTFRFCATPAAGGEEQSILLTANTLPNTFEAGDHLILTLRMSPEMTLEITKVEVKNVTVAETIPETWLPKPKLEAEGFTDNELSFAETEKRTAAIQLNTAMGLEELKLTFDFEDKQFASLNGREYLLSNADDKALVERTLGITLPAIGTKDARIDLSVLVANMQTNAGETQTNTLTLDAKANGRWSSEDQEVNRTYTMVCRKPEFNINVYPGNIWTREFTVNALTEEDVISGDYATLNENLVYQYRTTEGQDWINFADGRRQNGLQPNTQYYVRGLYRGVIPCGETTIQTYPILEIENGNLNEYSIVRGEDRTSGISPGDYGAQFEWTAWTTINEITAGYCAATAYSYSSRSGTRPVSDTRPGTNDNTAAWIITMGYGYGGTNSSPKSVTPSELVYDKTWENATHPTGIHFWYKYAPFEGDKSDISVIVYNDEQIIGEGTLQETQTISSYSQEGYTLNITYDPNYVQLEPNRILITFRSGFNTSVESRESGGLLTAKTANPKFRGSELYIDDISLIYDK